MATAKADKETKPKATAKKDPVKEANSKPLPVGQYVQSGRIVDAWGKEVK